MNVGERPESILGSFVRALDLRWNWLSCHAVLANLPMKKTSTAVLLYGMLSLDRNIIVMLREFAFPREVVEC
jgi:hypothetical protein